MGMCSSHEGACNRNEGGCNSTEQIQTQTQQTVLEKMRQESAELMLLAKWDTVFVSLLQQISNIKFLPKDHQGREAKRLHRVLKAHLKQIVEHQPKNQTQQDLWVNLKNGYGKLIARGAAYITFEELEKCDTI